MFIILTGNYNFFNLLTLALCLSLLDDQHVNFWLRKADKISNNGTINITAVYVCRIGKSKKYEEYQFYYSQVSKFRIK